MTNKESKAAAGAAPEERGIITPDTILKRFNLYNDIISKLRQQNLENGLDAKRKKAIRRILLKTKGCLTIHF
jgi:hypothetical protein